MSVRAAKKLATRNRVLEAAKDLFEEVGFEDTTVRMIADHAQVAVGSVFTTFDSKADILGEVMRDRLEGLYDELDRMLPLLRGSTLDRLRSVLAIHYDFEMRSPRLFLAHIAASFNIQARTAQAPFGRNLRLKTLLLSVLTDGVAAEEVRADIDLEILVSILVSAYGWNVRRAAYDGADADALTYQMDLQLELLMVCVCPQQARLRPV